MFGFPGDFDLVTLVLLSSVFASTVNAILIGFVLCTFSTLMLLLIKYGKKNILVRVIGVLGMSPGGVKWSRQTAQNKIFEYAFKMASVCVC